MGRIAWLGVVVIGAFLASAQTAEVPAKPGKQPPPGTLHTITIEGAHLYNPADIARLTGLRIGQRITGPALESARQGLLALELFNNVSQQFRYSAGAVPAYDVTFALTENEQTFPLRFDRLGVSDDTIRAYLKTHVPLYADRIPATDAVLKRYTTAVDDALAQAHAPTKVRAQVSNDDPKQLTVLFASAAPAQNISRVIVSGNQAIDTGTILRAVNQVAVGVPLSDSRLKLILDGAIKPLYAAKGFAAVTFPKIDTEPSTANLGVVVKVQIQEGPQFKFGAVRFHGNGIDEEEIRSAIPFKPGQLFNGDLVDSFRTELTRRMHRRGLLDATIANETQPDDAHRVVAVTYDVTPGAIYNFRQLDIHGLDSTTEPIVSKLWGEKPGKPFNPEYPEFFLKRLGEQNLFENLNDTRSDYHSDPSTHTVTVSLYFKGGQPTNEKERKKREEEERRKAEEGGSAPPE